MNLFIIISSIIFTILSTAIISYISIATMVGPWIAPSIVLMSSILLKLKRKISKEESSQKMAIIQTVAATGGIVGMAVGFSLPTLYFLDPNIFNSWLKSPFYFCSILAAACISAGGLGIWLGRCFENKLLEKEKLPFPVSQLIYNMITSQSQEKQAKKMFFGFSSTWILCFFRDGLLKFKGFIPKTFYIFPSFLGAEAAIALSPMLWAIGFITGVKIIFPLLIGMISKYAIVYPINHHGEFLPFKLFDAFNDIEFITALCSGLVIFELTHGVTKFPAIIWEKIKNRSKKSFFGKTNFLNNLFNAKSTFSSFLTGFEPLLVILMCAAFLYYLNFSFIALSLLIIFTAIFTYQLSYLGGKIGLITFGRFATFIMVPMMLIFKLDYVQITFLCVFFNICAGTCSDLLFDYKVGNLCNVDDKKIHRYQWAGLIITSLCIGILLWLLFTNFQLGSADLFAQRGKSRALLIQSLNFDWKIVLMGFFYGFVLSKFRISPTMVFGGLLMPNNLTIGLMIGAFLSWISKNPKEQSHIWSGVFAGESIWIMFSILLKIFA